MVVKLENFFIAYWTQDTQIMSRRCNYY